MNAPDAGTNGAAKVRDVPATVVVVAVVSVNEVPLTIVAMVSPKGTPDPETTMPTASAAVLVAPPVSTVVVVWVLKVCAAGTEPTAPALPNLSPPPDAMETTPVKVLVPERVSTSGPTLFHAWATMPSCTAPLRVMLP